MKYFFTTVFAALFSATITAQEIPVNLEGLPDSTPNNPHRSPALFLSVTYEDNEVYVYAPYVIESMEVVIYDVAGEAIYTYTSAMVSGKNTIILPSTVSESKFCIELNFNGRHLLGYF